MSDTAIATQTAGIVERAELSVEDVRSQVEKIQQLMHSLMKPDEHYGVIPGTNKPSLLKAGAEKLGFMFRLVPEFEVERHDLPGCHREYEVRCVLRHMVTGAVVGHGVGNCSTMESKYRWRKLFSEQAVGPVPKQYWSIERDNHAGRQAALVEAYGPGKYRTKKTDGQWKVFRIEGEDERVENPDIADTYNTVLKMAKKRAHVDAMITATAASDIFTQDIEDLTDSVKPSEQEVPPKPARSRKDPERQKIVDEIVKVYKHPEFTDEERKQLKKVLAELKTHDQLVDHLVATIAEQRRRKAARVDEAAEAGWRQGAAQNPDGTDPAEPELSDREVAREEEDLF